METSRPKDAAVKRQCLVNALCYGLSRAPVERYCSESQSIIVRAIAPFDALLQLSFRRPLQPIIVRRHSRSSRSPWCEWLRNPQWKL